MATAVASSDYRNYSEIDYILGSDLHETPWGIGRLMQRFPLFDLSKRHIPYLLLIHKVFFNVNFPKEDRNEVLNSLLDGLYREVLRKNKRNQLIDFFPKYFVIRLLFDLYRADYRIDKLVRGLDNEHGPVMDILKYGDCSADGFPQSFWMFLEKCVFIGKSRDIFLSEIARSCLSVHNFNGFYHILESIKDKPLVSHFYGSAAIIHVERNEIGKALKIAESERNKAIKSAIYLDIALSLSRAGKLDVLRELKHTTSAPELLFGIVFGMMDYHSRRNEHLIVYKLLDEAFVFLGKIKDYYIRILYLIWIMEFTYKIGNSAKFENSKEDILLIDNWLTDKERNNTRHFFCRKLISIGQYDEAKSYILKWFVPDEAQGNFWQQQILHTTFQVMVEQELNIIDMNIRHDRIFQPEVPSKSIVNYFKPALEIAGMIMGDIFKEESMQIIAGRMAKQGFYEEAFKIRDSIKESSFQTLIESSIPMYALANCNVAEALHSVEMISDEKTRLSVQLCMAPHLEKLQHPMEATRFIREWSNYIFQNS